MRKILPSAMAAGSSKVAQVEERSSIPLLLGRHETLSSFAITSNTLLWKALYSHRDSISLPKVLTKTFTQHLRSQNLFMKILLIQNEVRMGIRFVHALNTLKCHLLILTLVCLNHLHIHCDRLRVRFGSIC